MERLMALKEWHYLYFLRDRTTPFTQDHTRSTTCSEETEYKGGKSLGPELLLEFPWERQGRVHSLGLASLIINVELWTR